MAGTGQCGRCVVAFAVARVAMFCLALPNSAFTAASQESPARGRQAVVSGVSPNEMLGGSLRLARMRLALALAPVFDAVLPLFIRIASPFALLLCFHSGLFARDFDSIVYTSRDGLCSVDPSGRTPPSCPGIFLKHPKFNPDGRLIAAVRELSSILGGGPLTDIVIINRQGIAVQPLVGSKDFIRPTWFPTGRHIFAISYGLSRTFGRWDWPSGQKKIIPIDGLEADCGLGKDLTAIESDSFTSARPLKIQSISVAPSGKKLALLCDFKGIAVAALESDAAHVTKILTPIFSYVSVPDWLDDDRLLVIARKIGDRAPRLWEMDTNTGATRAISISELRFRDFVTIGPDRRSVVVTASLPGELSWSLWHVDLNGTAAPIRLTTGTEDIGATWAAEK